MTLRSIKYLFFSMKYLSNFLGGEYATKPVHRSSICCRSPPSVQLSVCSGTGKKRITICGTTSESVEKQVLITTHHRNASATHLWQNIDRKRWSSKHVMVVLKATLRNQPRPLQIGGRNSGSIKEGCKQEASHCRQRWVV